MRIWTPCTLSSLSEDPRGALTAEAYQADWHRRFNIEGDSTYIQNTLDECWSCLEDFIISRVWIAAEFGDKPILSTGEAGAYGIKWKHIQQTTNKNSGLHHWRNLTTNKLEDVLYLLMIMTSWESVPSFGMLPQIVPYATSLRASPLCSEIWMACSFLLR